MGGAQILKPDILDISKITRKKILAFGAHSDDLEFCAGGSLMLLNSEGSKNHLEVVIATDGNMGTHNVEENHANLISKRIEEARLAAKHLGAKDVRFWNYPDLALEERKKKLLKHVVKELLRVKPDIVITFDPWGEYDPLVHPDHRALAWAVTEGVLLSTLPKWVHQKGLGKRFLSPKPQLWLMCAANPNAVVDVSPIWQERIELLRLFISQFDDDFQWDRMSAWVDLTFRRVGKLVDVEHAEGFRILEYMGEWSKGENA